ncbi:hypothetical protein AB0901_31060 [Streptomyces roseifaciens]
MTPPPGRHSARYYQTDAPAPAPVDPWSQPWTTPTPAHIIERHTPLRGEDVALARPYVLAEETLELRTVQHERRNVLRLALDGIDAPYSYPGAPFPASAWTTGGAA